VTAAFKTTYHFTQVYMELPVGRHRLNTHVMGSEMQHLY